MEGAGVQSRNRVRNFGLSVFTEFTYCLKKITNAHLSYPKFGPNFIESGRKNLKQNHKR
jgi:hypothetical protein